MAHNQKIDAAPVLAPGCDFFTRSVRGPFIDTGVDIEANTPIGHRIYVCEDTVGEWARMFGWIAPADAALLIEGTSMARLGRIDAELELRAIRHVIKALEQSGFRIPAPEEVPEPVITAFPHHKGAGWWLLSNGDTIRGSRAEANDAEAESIGVAIEAHIEARADDADEGEAA